MGSLAAEELLVYPDVRRDESVVDNYHGVIIPDPYRWLEDPDADEVKDFVEKQVKLTQSYLQNCETREKFKGCMTALFDHPRYHVPFKYGDKYFYFFNTGLQDQDVLYVQENLEAEAEVLLDPNTLSEDGTVALNTYSVSENAKYLAVGLSSSGTDWVNIKVIRIADKTTEPDSLSWVKFSSITWSHDSKGFVYSRYPAPKEQEELDAGTETNINLNHQLFYHFLGTEQSEDILCWKDPENPEWIVGADITEDGKYILLYITKGSAPVNRLYYCNLESLPQGIEGFKGKEEMLPFQKFIDNFEAEYILVANDDTEFTFQTNKNAPRYKLVKVDLGYPESWSDLVQESEKDVLKSAVCVNGNQILVSYLSDVTYVLQVRDLQSGKLLHNLPIDIGSVSGVFGRRKYNEIFIGFASFLTPRIIYQCNLNSEKPYLVVFRETIVPGFDRSNFETKQVFLPSKDGTQIPMFIVCKKNISLDSSHPTMLSGYGGFNVNITPSFSVRRIVSLKHLGAVSAVANIRGGGEYGEEWHKAGSLANKQNCFDDFICAAEFLISEGYTQPKKLCIEGGSNGGLLVGACINQRPDLFGCALAHVGVMDMLRFHKFTIGHAWTTDYGCSDNEAEFRWLIKYSPLHNVKRPWEDPRGQGVQYPATMLLTADHDDRVVPHHSLKYLATMQYVLCKSMEHSPQTNPIIGRIDTKAGHGAGVPTQKLIDKDADILAFLAKVVGASWVD